MRRRCTRPVALGLLALGVAGCGSKSAPSAAPAQAPPSKLNAALVLASDANPTFLRSVKEFGDTGLVVLLDEDVTAEQWAEVAERAASARLDLFAWIEVGRNPSMADAHPEWMASLGGHHDDWRARFPDAPPPNDGEVAKAYPWVPIGYREAYHAHSERIFALLDRLGGRWSGVFLNDLQGGPSSCGCGNDQCRWALDYGSTPTAEAIPGDDAAARLVRRVQARYQGKGVIPVWTLECDSGDGPTSKGGTGRCGGVPCFKGDCWPKYAKPWNAVVEAAEGPVAVLAMPEVFGRKGRPWGAADARLVLNPPRGGAALAPGRAILVVENEERGLAASKGSAAVGITSSVRVGFPLDQSWRPRAVKPH